jgi:hypothetical protein
MLRIEMILPRTLIPLRTRVLLPKALLRLNPTVVRMGSAMALKPGLEREPLKALRREPRMAIVGALIVVRTKKSVEPTIGACKKDIAEESGMGVAKATVVGNSMAVKVGVLRVVRMEFVVPIGMRMPPQLLLAENVVAKRPNVPMPLSGVTRKELLKEIVKPGLRLNAPIILEAAKLIEMKCLLSLSRIATDSLKEILWWPEGDWVMGMNSHALVWIASEPKAAIAWT